MIDEKINNSLKELEQCLKDVESARKQVEKIVNSYDGLNSSTVEYITKLGSVSTKIQEYVDVIGNDYTLKVKNFEKDRDVIMNAANSAIEKLSNMTDDFKNSLVKIQTKLKYSIIINVISLVSIFATMLFLLFH